METTTQDFTAVLHLATGRDEVLTWLNSAEGVSRWWGPARGDGSMGGTLSVLFGDNGANVVRVREAGPARVVWEPLEPTDTKPTFHVQEWLGTTIEFDLEAADDGTELTFRHRGLTPSLACWGECFAGWTYFMASLDTLDRTGTGTPYTG